MENEITQQMEVAAKEAEQELASLNPEAVKVVAAWMQKWFMKAGYKRLAKALIATLKA